MSSVNLRHFSFHFKTSLEASYSRLNSGAHGRVQYHLFTAHFVELRPACFFSGRSSDFFGRLSVMSSVAWRTIPL